jgi:SAM-dependent methyltransferase
LSKVQALLRRLERRRLGERRQEELDFWRGRRDVEGDLGQAHYRYFYTEHFELDEGFYAGKRMLDVGCGPRGSLEWAEMAAERVGLDPLVPKYRALGIDRHRMRYVAAACEQIPFEDGHFDVVTSFNSLDHVDDVEQSLREIRRVTRPGGSFLVIVELNHPPRPTEPQCLGFDLLDGMREAGWSLTWEKCNAMVVERHTVFGSLLADRPHEDGPAVLSAHLAR